MNERVKEFIQKILDMPEVDDAITLSAEGGLYYKDGRLFIPLNIYLKKSDDGESLGVHVEERITTRDKFGG
jgi:hypothetical protein